MALQLADRVQVTSTSYTTSSFTLGTTVTGFQAFTVLTSGNTTYYTATDSAGNWEVGYGTYTTGALARTTILASSNSGSVVTFSGTVNVWVDYPAEKAVIQDANGVVTTPVLNVTSTTSTTPNLTFNASNSGFTSGATVANSYLQTVIQNKSGTSGASTNYVLSNDLGTDSSYYGEFGMNSSGYTASGTFADFYSINNGIYFSGHDGDITVGSGNGYKLYFAWGSTGASAHVINASGAIGLSTNLGTSAATTGTSGFGTSGQVLTSAGSSSPPTWTTPAPATTYTTNYIPYGQGTTTLNQSSSFTYDGTTEIAPIQASSNGLVLNKNTVSSSYSIPSGYSASSVGPITLNSGVSVTVPSGSRWLVF